MPSNYPGTDPGKAAENTPAKPDEAKPDASKGDDAKADEPKADGAAKDQPQASAATLSEEEIAAIKKLPEDDARIALAQAACPVSGENLGAMGTPVKVTAEGQTFFLCCKGCKKDVDKDPKAVLAKLNK
jgi:YHS domain-containing protein